MKTGVARVCMGISALLVNFSGCVPHAPVTEASLRETEPLYERNADVISHVLRQREECTFPKIVLNVPEAARDQTISYLRRVGAVSVPSAQACYSLTITYAVVKKPPTDEGEYASESGFYYSYRVMLYPHERLVVARAKLIDKATHTLLAQSEGGARFDPGIDRLGPKSFTLPGMSTITRRQAIALAARRALYTMR